MNLHDISKFRRIPLTGPRQDPAYLHSESYAPQRAAKANIGHRSCSVAMGHCFPCLAMACHSTSMMGRFVLRYSLSLSVVCSYGWDVVIYLYIYIWFVDVSNIFWCYLIFFTWDLLIHVQYTYHFHSVSSHTPPGETTATYRNATWSFRTLN